MTIKQLFETYPLKPWMVAAGLGRTTRWMMYQAEGIRFTPATQAANRLKIQEYFRTVGRECATITLDVKERSGAMAVRDFFVRYPFSASGIATKVGRSREWITGVINGRLLKDPENQIRVIKLLEGYIRKAGRELSEINLQ